MSAFLITLLLFTLICSLILLGFRCEEHDNPADFVLDVITSCEKKEEKSADDKGMYVAVVNNWAVVI